MHILSRWYVRFGGAFLMGIGLAFLYVQGVYAYNVSRRWATNSAQWSRDITWPSEWLNPALYGAGAWTNVTTSSWTWVHYTPDSLGVNRLFKGTIDGPYPGGANLGGAGNWRICGTNVCGFSITIDKDENWYSGTGTPGSSQPDLQSVVTHEFGHAAALGHTDEAPLPSGVNCNGNNSARPTMCSQLVFGTSWWRTLEADDKNGLSSVYA